MRDENFKELKVGQKVYSTVYSNIGSRLYEVMEVNHEQEKVILKQLTEGNGHGVLVTLNKIECERHVCISEDVNEHKCEKCNSDLILMTGYADLTPDDEPFKSGETVIINIKVGKHVCAYYCRQCDHLTNIWEE